MLHDNSFTFDMVFFKVFFKVNLGFSRFKCYLFADLIFMTVNQEL